MKPPPFAYVRAGSIDEAAATLADDDDAKVLAGGQSLIPLLNLRLARPSVLVDLSFMPAEPVRHLADAAVVVVPATTTHSSLLAQKTVLNHVPLLRACLPLIGHVAVRNRGTMGGSLAHADPSAELCTAAVATGAEVVTRSTAGERTVPFADVVQGPFMTSLRPDEIVVAARWPVHTGFGAAYEELALRAGDFAVVGVATTLHLAADGAIDAASLAVSGLASTPVRLDGCEEVLHGERPGDRLFRDVARRAAAAGHPVSDAQAPAEYRRALAEELTYRALSNALTRCTGTED